MKLFSPFDDKIDDNVNEEVSEKRRKKSRLIKSIMRYILILFIYQLAILLIYAICFSSLMEQYIRANMMSTVDIFLGIYSAITIFLLAFWSSFDLKDDGQLRRSFLHQLEKKKISLKLCMKYSIPKATLYTAIYFIFQLPFCMFYHSYGFDHVYVTIFEQYHIMNVGFMQLTGIGIMGTFINCSIFFFSLMIFHYLIFTSWNKNRIIKDNKNPST